MGGVGLTLLIRGLEVAMGEGEGLYGEWESRLRVSSRGQGRHGGIQREGQTKEMAEGKQRGKAKGHVGYAAGGAQTDISDVVI